MAGLDRSASYPFTRAPRLLPRQPTPVRKPGAETTRCQIRHAGPDVEACDTLLFGTIKAPAPGFVGPYAHLFVPGLFNDGVVKGVCHGLRGYMD